jgi:hypothetical protein
MLAKYFQLSVEKYAKYGSTPNVIDIAKFLAIIIMVIDHIGFYFFPYDLWFRSIGRIGFPVWFFFAGYSRPGKFSYEIIILAVLLAFFKTFLLLPVFPLNALVTIILCRLYADFLRKGNKFTKWKILNIFTILIALLVWIPVTNFMFEYGTLAFVFTACGVLQREMPGHIHTSIAFGFATISFIFVEYVLFGFSVPQFICMAAGTLITVHFLSGLKMKHIPYLDKFGLVTKTGVLLARNSLYFYFLHIVIFAILSRIVFPERYMIFKWL